MKKSKRREKEYNKKRAEILKSAERIFSSKGFYKSSMAEISFKSRFAVGTLYNFFKNKNDLYFSVIEEKMASLLEKMRVEIQDSNNISSIGIIRRVVEIIFKYFEENKNFFKIYMIDRIRFEWELKDELGKRIHKMYILYMETVKNIIKDGINMGELKGRDPEELSFTLLGIINSFIFRWVINKEKEPLINRVDNLMDLFLNGVKK
jgi:AcrR family transcriptional regulator